jgi:hypothetical protein
MCVPSWCYLDLDWFCFRSSRAVDQKLCLNASRCVFYYQVNIHRSFYWPCRASLRTVLRNTATIIAHIFRYALHFIPSLSDQYKSYTGLHSPSTSGLEVETPAQCIQVCSLYSSLTDVSLALTPDSVFKPSSSPLVCSPFITRPGPNVYTNVHCWQVLHRARMNFKSKSVGPVLLPIWPHAFAVCPRIL